MRQFGAWLAMVICALVPVSAVGAATPTVTGCVPNSGIVAGGHTVIISGTNFTSPAVTAVAFGGNSVASFTVISDTLIQAETPAHAAGTVSVDVTNASGTNVANALFTYTPDNPSVQVVLKVTIPKRADIRWGNGTTVDDAAVDHTLPAERITAYAWTVKDPAGGTNLDMNTLYATDDATNAKTIMVSTNNPTNSTLTVAAVTSRTLHWNFGPAAASDVFRMRAKMGAGAFQTLSDVAVDLTNYLAKAADLALVVDLVSPTDVGTASAGVTQTATVSLIATPN